MQFREPAIVRGLMRLRRLDQVLVHRASLRPRFVNPTRSGAWTGAARQLSSALVAARAEVPAKFSDRATPAAGSGAVAGDATGSEDRTMTGLTPRTKVLGGVIIALALALNVHAAEPVKQSYASSSDAADALMAAARSRDTPALRAVLGPGSASLISSGDRHADEAALRRFVEAYDAKHALVPDGPDRIAIEVGSNDWRLPIPIVQRGGRWNFDLREGAQEIVDRRIGGNEIRAIEVCLVFVDAQNDYFELMKQETGRGEFAQRLVSARGRHDGLYWPATDGQDESPLQPLVTQAQGEGYPGQMLNQRLAPYQGYFFRILYSQGAESPGGEKKYVLDGRMTGGFALVAWPARYASTGIMSFIVSQDGVVFQKDLGPETSRVVATITQFNSDPSWTQVNVTDQ